MKLSPLPLGYAGLLYCVNFLLANLPSGYDIPKPISVYGKTKLEGENNVLKQMVLVLICRTSVLFGWPEVDQRHIFFSWAYFKKNQIIEEKRRFYPQVSFYDDQEIKITSFEVEIASTSAQHKRGLMHRENLPEDKGMLFTFKQEQPLSFWMKYFLSDMRLTLQAS